jgi:hypothetical protein
VRDLSKWFDGFVASVKWFRNNHAKDFQWFGRFKEFLKRTPMTKPPPLPMPPQQPARADDVEYYNDLVSISLIFVSAENPWDNFLSLNKADIIQNL